MTWSLSLLREVVEEFALCKGRERRHQCINWAWRGETWIQRNRRLHPEKRKQQRAVLKATDPIALEKLRSKDRERQRRYYHRQLAKRQFSREELGD